MRVQSISEVNTNRQENPFPTQTAGYAVNGKQTPGSTFEDYFKRYSLQASAPVITGATESRIAGAFWGFYPGLKVQQKNEPTLKDSAS